MTAFLMGLLGSAGPIAVLVVMAVVFAETGLLLGVALPGDSLLFSIGVLAAAGALHLPLVLVIAGIAAAAFVGNQLGYFIGNRFGPRVFVRKRSRFLGPAQVERAAALVERYGAAGVVMARFVPIARTVVPVVAGLGSMQPRRFLLSNAAGAVAWSGLVVGAGFLLGGVPFVAAHLEVCLLAFVVISLVPMIWHARRAKNQRSQPRQPEPALVGVE